MPLSRSKQPTTTQLPPLSSFSFARILESINPEIQPSIDAISLICARSAYSLANEHAAHLPPQGEIRAGAILPIRGRHGLWIRTPGFDGGGLPTQALSVVHEQSSNSGSSPASSRGPSEAGTLRSAYNSLQDVLSGAASLRRRNTDSGSTHTSTGTDISPKATWAVVNSQSSIVLLRPIRTSRQVSTTLVIEKAAENGTLEPVLASSLPPTPSAGLPSWLLPWESEDRENGLEVAIMGSMERLSEVENRRTAEDLLKGFVDTRHSQRQRTIS